MAITFKQDDAGGCPRGIMNLLGCFLLLLVFEMSENLFIVEKVHTSTSQQRSIHDMDETTTRDGGDSRTSFRTSSRRCTALDEANLDKSAFKSQSREDVMLLKWFNGLCNGTYVEMGALDGITFSNSFAYNHLLGWKGVLVELIPSNYAALVNNRQHELAVLNAGVCNEKRTLHYIAGTRTGNRGWKIGNGIRPEVSGVWEFTAPTFRNLWWPNLTIANATEIACSPLGDIFREFVNETNFFDFFSLDIEGGELEALKSIDYNKVGFGILFVEADEHNQRKNLALRTFLESKGYRFILEYQRSYWFANPDFSSIYEDVLY